MKRQYSQQEAEKTYPNIKLARYHYYSDLFKFKEFISLVWLCLTNMDMEIEYLPYELALYIQTLIYQSLTQTEFYFLINEQPTHLIHSSGYAQQDFEIDVNELYVVKGKNLKRDIAVSYKYEGIQLIALTPTYDNSHLIITTNEGFIVIPLFYAQNCDYNSIVRVSMTHNDIPLKHRIESFFLDENGSTCMSHCLFNDKRSFNLFSKTRLEYERDYIRNSSRVNIESNLKHLKGAGSWYQIEVHPDLDFACITTKVANYYSDHGYLRV